jgi:hypothetical protein
MQGSEHVPRMQRRADALTRPAAGVCGEDEAPGATDDERREMEDLLAAGYGTANRIVRLFQKDEVMTFDHAMERATTQLDAHITQMLDASFGRMIACGMDRETAEELERQARAAATVWRDDVVTNQLPVEIRAAASEPW